MSASSIGRTGVTLHRVPGVPISRRRYQRATSALGNNRVAAALHEPCARARLTSSRQHSLHLLISAEVSRPQLCSKVTGVGGLRFAHHPPPAPSIHVAQSEYGVSVGLTN